MGEISTPILFIVFNRPATTAKVFEKIKEIKPDKLYVAADGPRPGRTEDIENCKLTRAIIDKVDWNCKVFKLFRDENLGCGKGVSGAIDWFFGLENEGIILEDDCVPDLSFFKFCQALLDKYRNDERIMHIGGTNFQRGNKRGDASYYFSAMVHVWGWATWKRAWAKYDFNVKDIEDFIRKGKIKKYFSDIVVHDYWYKIFRNMNQHKIDTWDYQWHYSVWNNGGLAIIPQFNLISNIGFGADATHTQSANEWANQPVCAMNEIIHPQNLEQNIEADLYTFYSHYKPAQPSKKSLIKRIVQKIGLK